MQLDRHGELLGARHEEQVLVPGYRLQHPELERVRDRRVVGAAAETLGQLGP
ncbi:hypothetical protein SAV31267_050400 [Streptomyces avermitilis]|uniref:Uncharacterized protein n=1 Tax=Streptomyces avermitilis TaxID=33903 RepID=A0A4D4MVU6_STRAX|nr:hypothetical protein SAV31267_050400 [Streptomyces avermitilis]